MISAVSTRGAVRSAVPAFLSDSSNIRASMSSMLASVRFPSATMSAFVPIKPKVMSRRMSYESIRLICNLKKNHRTSSSLHKLSRLDFKRSRSRFVSSTWMKRETLASVFKRAISAPNDVKSLTSEGESHFVVSVYATHRMSSLRRSSNSRGQGIRRMLRRVACTLSDNDPKSSFRFFAVCT